jgi:tetrahydromethanopterin S-methyltransferase subunit F
LRTCFALGAFITLTARSFILDSPTLKNRIRGIAIALLAAVVIYVALGAVALVWK